MDPKVRSKINRIAAEANAIARELEEISNGIGHEFKGIGWGHGDGLKSLRPRF